MQVQWTFGGCSSNTKRTCRSYWKKKQGRLERVLSGIPQGSKILRLTVYCHQEKVNRIEARGVLVVPGRSLAAQLSGIELASVLDGLADKLVLATKKYKERSVQFSRQKRRQQITDDLLAAQDLIVWDETAARKESFFAILRPLLSFMERHARSELKIFELEGVVPPGQVDPADIVSETVLLAWERFSERPKDLPLEFWLLRLMHEILRQVEWDSQLISLDQKFHLVDIDHVTAPDWFEEVLGYEEEYSLAELIPDAGETEKWEGMDELGRNFHILTVLQKFPSYQRQAYLLHKVNDYSLEEVSLIQGRKMDDIKKDINKSRETLQGYMHEAGMIY